MRVLSLKLTTLLVGLFFFFLGSSISLAQSNNTQAYNPLFIIQEKNEKIVKKMERAYKWHQYEKVVELSKKISILYPLSAKDNLIVAESYLRLGYPKEAISYANKVISLRKNTFEACRARLIKIAALIVMGKTKGLKKRLNKILNSFCSAKFKEDILALMTLLGKREKVPADVLKNIVGVVIKAKGLYLLRKNKLRAAKHYIFLYLNVYGSLYEAPKLLFKLAEGYFKNHKKAEAKVLYELIITRWDGTKQALLSKFRLYEIAYQRIVIKQLVPKEMREDLISYIEEIKYRYPKEKITQEAWLLEIQIYRQYKEYKKLRECIKGFLRAYPHFKNIKQIYGYYCEAMSTLFNEYEGKKNYEMLFKLIKEDAPFLKMSSCGYPYYVLGSVLFNYDFYLHSAYELINAEEIGVPYQYLPDLLVKLDFLAFQTGEKEIFNLITERILKSPKLNAKLKSSGYWNFCQACYYLPKDLSKAENYLGLVLKSKLSRFYKWQLLHLFRDRGVTTKNYAKALEYTQNPLFNATSWDYLLLAVETFKKAPKLFPRVISAAIDSFPNSTELKWVEAYYLEKHGKFKEALRLWKALGKGKALENELAKEYEKIQKLTNRVYQTVY